MDSGFEGKVALVTGAGSGIGQAIARALAEGGARVLITGRTEKSLKETAALGSGIDYKVADVTDTEQVAALVSTIEESHGRLDVLVNNAGWAPVTPLRAVSLEEYDRAFGINVRAVIDLSRQVLPLLLESRGSIVNVSSTAAVRPIANMSVYSASKAAMSALSHSWAQELAADGVRVNNVVVGPIETPIYDKTDLNDESAQAHRRFVLSTVPQGRFGEPSDVAGVVAFLASDAARFVTGGDYSVDGGVLA